jgi:hypothetical protein
VHLNQLFRDRPPRFARDATALANTLRKLGGKPDFDRERQVGLDHFVRTYAAMVAPVHQELPFDSAKFELGMWVERTLCPENVYQYMSFEKGTAHILSVQPNPDDLIERVAASAGLVIGFRSFSPGSVRCASTTIDSLIRSLELADIWSAQLQSSIIAPVSPPGRKTNLGQATAIQRPEEFQCCVPPCAGTYGHFARLHAAIVEKLGAPNNSLLQWMKGPAVNPSENNQVESTSFSSAPGFIERVDEPLDSGNRALRTDAARSDRRSESAGEPPVASPSGESASPPAPSSSEISTQLKLLGDEIRKCPQGDFVKSTEAAKIEGIKVSTLATYRHKAELKSPENGFGQDRDGRKWKTHGPKQGRVLYLKASLTKQLK